jgi:hypothetical protein
VRVCMSITGEGWWPASAEKPKGLYLRGVCMSVNPLNVESFG